MPYSHTFLTVTGQRYDTWLEGLSVYLIHQSSYCAIKYQKLRLAERTSHLHNKHKILPSHLKPQPHAAIRE